MPVTYEEVLAVLRPDEPDFESAATLGPDALPHLRMIVQGDDPGLAMKATHLAARIATGGSAEVLETAAQSGDAVVRVAAADAARYLPGHLRTEVLMRLLDDTDVGVRKFALMAVPETATPELRMKVRSISESEGDSYLSDLSRQVLRSLPE